MAQEFINAAAQVLRDHGKPLLVHDIYQKAVDDRLLKSNGKTPVNTLRARLSEHIRLEKDASIFKRIRPNLFALREWDQFPEYEAKRFDKNRSKETVVCINCKLIPTGESRKAIVYSGVCYCDGKTRVMFIGNTEGQISVDSRGTHGFQWDPIFIPNGSLKTYGEMEQTEKLTYSQAVKAYDQLKKHLKINDK